MLRRILLYSCTRYWVSFVILDNHYCPEEILEEMVLLMLREGVI
jgi:hypothetical protein